VKLLAKFEHSIERLMEGTTSTLFNQSLQPAEIGKRLERSMLDNQRASMGTSIVPNQFVVKLNPKDFAQFADYRTGLARQMESWLAQVATERNLSVVDRIRVSILEDASARRRNPNIAASISDNRSQPVASPSRQSPPPAQATSVFRLESGATRMSASLRALDGPQRGRTFIVPPGTTSIGRAPENDIVLDSPDVSRRHARLECSEHRIRLHDLNSTNGARVNGDAVRIADVENGDELSFGAQRFAIEIHSTSHDRDRPR